MIEAPGAILEWDSRFFGCRIARCNFSVLRPAALAQLLAWCKAEHVACLYFLAEANDPDTVRLVEMHDFHLADIRVELERPNQTVRPEPIRESPWTICPASAEDLPALSCIAAEAHRNTRFFGDPNIPKTLAARLYVTWIEKCVAGQLADVTLVAKQLNEVVGYVTAKVDAAEAVGRIGLVGISQDFRQNGIGSLLLRGVLEWFTPQPVSAVRVVTQGRNVAGQRLYQRFGFRTYSVQLWYHKWFLPQCSPVQAV